MAETTPNGFGGGFGHPHLAGLEVALLGWGRPSNNNIKAYLYSLPSLAKNGILSSPFWTRRDPFHGQDPFKKI